MIFLFKFPGVFSHDGINAHLSYYTDFLSYIVSPTSAPWIIALSLIAVFLPMLALIYWGVKMIFWFKARDGIFSLTGFVLWVLSLPALTVILFNEGISFAETGRTSSQNILTSTPDTLFIITDHKASNLKYDKEFSLPDEDYTIYMSDSTRQLFMPARLRLNIAENNQAKLEIHKSSCGRTRTEAVKKAELIIYNSRISNDTIFLDDFFTLPAGSKWRADFLTVKLFVPENTVLYFDSSSRNLFHNEIIIGKYKNNEEIDSKYDDTEPWDLADKFWVISENGLKESEKTNSKLK
jgi:hypothetical protein